ncbi:CaiB/BaiF CoA transferase family protein [Actinomadura bangladeshensis]|uniref:CoA transferase n=1 Tax=Actinomadura bangladeshensis TaxID=453573 RepID=A0A4R4NV66_9ACTN|nr:CoA transferase [Actinomadura bangladeshensis]TDC11927.1 CoA transferase [Actinomadura bangladeshensis]
MMALEGIKVLDAASMLAGPYCATLLGDLGAEVVKVEPPAGDETRRFGPRRGDDSGVFVGVNRNKRSVVLDLRTDRGREVLAGLVAWADIVVDNLRPQARRKLGLDYGTVSALNPRIISVSLSSFGADGPYAGRAGIDPVAQALTGFMAVTGPRGGAPTKAGPPVGDATASMLAAVGALAALRAREITGRGQQVDVSLIDGLLHVQAPYTGQYFLLGTQQPRTGNGIDWYAPYNAYRCGDGRYVHLACYNDKFFTNLCAALERPDLAEDDRFASNEARLAHRDELDRVIGEHLGELTRDEALERLWAADVIVGPVNDYDEVFTDPQVLHNGMVVETAHHTGPLRVTGVPVKLSDTPGSVRRPPPGLGEHTDEVLAELNIEEGDAS